MQRLNASSLSALAPAIAVPAYDRGAVTAGIVHIGIGAFHRGHMAVYVDETLAHNGNWGIIGASLRRPDTRDALAPQDYLYSLHVRDGEKASARIIGSVLDIIDASAQTGPLLEQLAQPQIRIVSLTVTEKGYCHDPATGRLSTDHPDIMHDLAHPDHPVSMPGIVVAAAERRRARGHGGLTVLSCDNLQGNGQIVRSVVTELAKMRDATLAAWIETHVTFPSTMVDRIVPALTDSDRAKASRVLGLDDAWPVITEPFSQWVVEDDFAAGRPDLEAAGVQLVADVAPYELMKLRLLNGAHSTMAYLGQLAGLTFVADAVRDPAIGAMVSALMTTEIVPTLSVPDADPLAYRDRLLARFANPSLNHRLAQIAMDGSQKLPQRLLAPLRERLASGESVALLCLAVAGWIAYLHAGMREGRFEIRDPMAARLAEAVGGAGDAEAVVTRVMQIEEIFGDDLCRSASTRATISRQLESLLTRGVAETIALTLAKKSPQPAPVTPAEPR